MKKLFLIITVLTVVMIIAPVMAEAGESSFGVVAHTQGTENDLNKIGANWIRINFNWQNNEDSAGVYNTGMEPVLADYHSAGQRVIGILVGEHTDYPDPSVDLNGFINGFSAYAGAMAAQYSSYDVLWEIWNEPEVFTAGGVFDDPVNYTQLARAAAAAIKANDPDAKVAACSMGWADMGFLQGCLDNYLLYDETIDLISFHGYHRGADAGVLDMSIMADYKLKDDINEMQSRISAARILQGFTQPVGIIDTERGYDLQVFETDKQKDSWSNIVYTESERSAYLARHFITEIAAGLEISVWYKGHNDSSSLYKGGIGSPIRPMGWVYKTLATEVFTDHPSDLINTKYSVTKTVHDSSIDTDTVIVESFVRDSGTEDETIIIGAWFQVEAFDGNILNSRTVAGDYVQEDWRPIAAGDTVIADSDITIYPVTWDNVYIRVYDLHKPGTTSEWADYTLASDTLTINNLPLGPSPYLLSVEQVDCDLIQELDLNIAGDFSGDCEVNLLDFSYMSFDWALDYDPDPYGFNETVNVVNYRFDENPLSEQLIEASTFSSPDGPDGYLGTTSVIDSDDAIRVEAQDYASWDEGGKLDFDGGRVAVVPAGIFNNDLSEFTIEFWAGNPDLQWSGGFLYLLEKAYGTGIRTNQDEMSFQAYSNGGSMGLGFRWFDTEGGVHALNADDYFWNSNWQHCAITYDSDGGTDNYKMYIDGVLTDSATVSDKMIRLDDNPICFGGLLDYDGSVYVANSQFHLDDFRMHDRVIDVPAESGYAVEFPGQQHQMAFTFDEPVLVQAVEDQFGYADGFLGTSTVSDADDAMRVEAQDYALWDEGGKLDFDGGRVAVVPAGIFNNDLSEFTIEFWAGNPDLQWSGGFLYLLEKAYIDSARSSQDEMSFQAYSNGGGMGLGFRWVDTEGGIHDLNADDYFWNSNWQHCAITYDSDGGTDNYKMYIDGVLTDSATVSDKMIRLDDNPICFGGLLDYDGSVYVANSQFHMDDFRIYDRVIDIATESGYVSGFELNTSSHVAFKFDDDPNGQTVEEYFGGWDGYLGNSRLTDVYDANMIEAGAYVLWDTGNKVDFLNDGIVTAPVDRFGNLDSFTIEFWAGNLNYQWSAGFLYLLDKAYIDSARTSQDEMSFQAYSNGGSMGLGFRWFDTEGNQHSLNAEDFFEYGGWHHCTVTYEDNGQSNNYKLYMDGQLVDQDTVESGKVMRMDANPICFGGLLDYDGSVYLSNSSFHMDDFRMYNYVIDVATEGGYVTGEPAALPGETCAEVWQSGQGVIVDLDQNCSVDISDLRMLAEKWLECNDPQGGLGCIWP